MFHLHRLKSLKAISVAMALMFSISAYAADNSSQSGDAANSQSGWQDAIKNLEKQLQKSQDESAANLAEATKNLDSQIEKIQTSLVGQIKDVSSQVQKVQGNLNELTEKVNSFHNQG